MLCKSDKPSIIIIIISDQYLTMYLYLYLQHNIQCVGNNCQMCRRAHTTNCTKQAYYHMGTHTTLLSAHTQVNKIHVQNSMWLQPPSPA